MAGSGKRKKSPVTVRGAWIPLSSDFLRSRVFAELSPLATKLLFALCGQLGYNAKGNGDLSAAPAILEPLGWTSKASLAAALAELQRVGLLCVTRQGSRRLCSLYAITLWPMDCDFAKLDHGPGCYSAEGWRNDATRCSTPNADRPASWNRPRKNTIAPPAVGDPSPRKAPPRGKVSGDSTGLAPAARAKAKLATPRVPPQRDTFLDKPSAALAVGLPGRHGSMHAMAASTVDRTMTVEVPAQIACSRFESLTPNVARVAGASDCVAVAAEP